MTQGRTQTQSDWLPFPSSPLQVSQALHKAPGKRSSGGPLHAVSAGRARRGRGLGRVGRLRLPRGRRWRRRRRGTGGRRRGIGGRPPLHPVLVLLAGGLGAPPPLLLLPLPPPGRRPAPASAGRAAPASRAPGAQDSRFQGVNRGALILGKRRGTRTAAVAWSDHLLPPLPCPRTLLRSWEKRTHAFCWPLFCLRESESATGECEWERESLNWEGCAYVGRSNVPFEGGHHSGD